MIKKVKRNVVLEVSKWIGSVVLLIMSLIINHIFYEYDFFIRRMVVFFIISMAVCLLLTTKSGKLLLVYGRESYMELQKVVWPAYRDTLSVTFIVIAVTVLLSLVLWGLDTILVHVISYGLRL